MKQVKTVSCAVCEETVELPDSAEEGDTFEHCGVAQRLKYRYGVFVAEPVTEE